MQPLELRNRRFEVWPARGQGQERRMTQPRPQTVAHWNHATPENTPRLRLKPKAPISGYVDGAWWPHTNVLQTEVPDLLAVLSVRLGTIDRVIFNIAEWATAPKKVPIDGRVVRLAGYHRQPVNTIEVLGLNRKKLVLLVIPAQTDPADARHALMAAATPGNTFTIRDLLMAGVQGGDIALSAASIE
jgi:hypothetical protein